MTQPLALVMYERLLPGTQLVNRLQDLGYRVLTVNGDTLATTAEQEKPMIVFADLVTTRVNVTNAIIGLKNNPATSHLPVVAFGDDKNPRVQDVARKAGATLVVNEVAVLNHLPQFLEQALQLD